MNFKTTWALFGVFFSVVIVMMLISLFGGDKTSAGKGYVLPTMRDQTKGSDIASVIIERFRDKEGNAAKEKLAFDRTETGWRLREPSARVNGGMVDQIIHQIRDAQRAEGSDRLPNDLEKFGLKSPAAVTTLQQKGGEHEWKLNLGNQSIGDEKAVVYATSSDETEPLPLPRRSIESLFKPRNDFLPLDLLNVSALNASYVNLQDAKAKTVLEKGSDGKWRFVDPAYGEADYEGEPPPQPAADLRPHQDAKAITGVKDLIETIGALRLESDADYQFFDASDALLAKHGVGSKPATLRIEVKRSSDSLVGGEAKEPITEVLLVGNKIETDEKKDAKKDEKKEPSKDDKYYVRLEGERSILSLSGQGIQAVLKVAETPAVLRNRDLVQLDTARTDAVDIDAKTSGGLFKLRRAGTPATWKLYRSDQEAKEAYSPAIDDLIKALNAKRQVKEFPPAKPDAEYGFDKSTVVLSFWTDGIKKEDAGKKDEAKEDDKKEEKDKDKKDEKKDDKKLSAEPKLKDETPGVRLTFGKKDKDLVYVKREAGKETTVAAVPASLLDKVNQGPLAYLDRILPSFVVADAVGLEIERANKDAKESFVAEKDDKSGIWLLKQPKELSGKNADAGKVAEILSELSRMHTDKLVAEKPADLDKLGLKPARVQATVTLKDKKKMTYLLGKEGDDKTSVYAKQGDRDLVFLVKASEVETTLHGSLEDLTVFRFAADKVRELKITGWRKPGKETAVFHVTREPGKSWTVKVPVKDFELDPLAVDGLLSGLANLKAQKFVVRKTGPEPRHLLGEKERPLHIEITLEGMPTPLTLSLGDLDAAAKVHYAQSSTLPGDVFLVPQKSFDEMLKAGPKYFQKTQPPPN